MAAITISDYIIGCVGFEVPTATLQAIFFNRGITEGVDASAVSLRLRELAIADCFKWAVTLPSGAKRVEDADAGWKHAETSASLSDADKDMYKKMADEIYVKYGEKAVTYGFKIHRL